MVRLAASQLYREDAPGGVVIGLWLGERAFVPIHSVGAPCPALGRAHSLLVTLDRSRLPRGVDESRVALAAEHGAAGFTPRGCSRPLAFAWALNLMVLLSSAAFLAYAAFTLQPTTTSVFAHADGADAAAASEDAHAAASDFRSTVARGYVLSLCISFLIKDPLVAMLIALMPARSGRSRRLWKAVAALLNGLLAL